MKLLTTSEAAEMLRLCPQSVRILCDQKKLVCIRHSPGGKRLIPHDSIEAYLASLSGEVEAYIPAVVAFDDTERRLKERSERLRRVK